MKNESQKLMDLVEDKRLLPQQKELMERWVNHLKTFKPDQNILDLTYVIREYGIYIKKPFEAANLKDIIGYLRFKIGSKYSITGNRILEVSKQSVMIYRYRINSFYRWILKHTNIIIEQELAYPKPKLVKKIQKSREQLCKERVLALLDNEIITTNRKSDRRLSQEELRKKYSKELLDEKNLRILNGFYDYKLTSGKVESHTGFVTKLYFLKRLGLYLKTINKTFKEATREDIQGFLSEVQKSISSKKEGQDKVLINTSYKAHLLDFYRFIYGMFEEEQPRKYPSVVAWLYQKRKKSHDKFIKEIIADQEIKQMITACVEVRDKSLIALFSDCSARVGEIVNVKIKDIKINDISMKGAEYKHSIATINLRGKTGERTNQLFYSVPHLRLWIMNHPRKNDPESPLFISTKENRYGQGLTAVGVNKILQRNARKSGIKRHIHAHLFRHTNLTRMARILSETELKIHAGWGSDSKMASVYVHLNEKDVANKILERYGLVPKEEKKKEDMFDIKICPNTLCSFQNPSEAQFCLKCGYPLTLNTAISLTKIKKQEDELQKRLFSKNIINVPQNEGIKETMYQILKSDPSLIEKLKEIIGLMDGSKINKMEVD